MNIELLEKIKYQITNESERFDMDTFYNNRRPCGTVACIAGWACLLSDHNFEDTIGNFDPIEKQDVIMNKALVYLDIPAQQDYKFGNKLFFISDWPEDLASEFKLNWSKSRPQDANKQAMAEIACRAIDRFIDQGGF